MGSQRHPRTERKTGLKSSIQARSRITGSLTKPPRSEFTFL